VSRLVVPTPPAMTRERPRRSDTHLHGRWLLLARVVWLAVAALCLSLFVAGIPAEFAQLQIECPTAVCVNGQLPPDGLRALQDLGLSLDFFAAYGVGLDVVIALVYSAVAALIFWRTPADRIALFVSLTLLTFGTATFPETLYTLAAAHPAWWPAVAVLNLLGSAAFSLFLYLFPDGRFVPGWTRWTALAWIAWQVPKYWIPTWPDVTTWLNAVVWLIALGTIVSAQVYRYRWVSTSVQRQQTKWVVCGIATALTGYLGVILALSFVAPTSTSAGALATLMVGFALMELAMLLIPLSIGIAVLRYRLFDVDVLINRTLVYGALTGTLALAYITCVVLLPVVMRPLTGSEPSQLMTVASTLAIAASFSPLRRRIQAAIDQRFYRRKYDAARTLAAFNAKMCDEVELQALIADLLVVVAETVQPAHVTLWFCAPLSRAQTPIPAKRRLR
jgi:hypothetical protein